ncbi:MAG: MlaD family protein [Bacteroidales bacterium]|nr:MlaD family protein [Bacteroidales bacterium]
MALNRNFKIGVFAVVAFVILVAGVNYLKGQDMLFRGNKYYSYYENVNGLTDASPVYYKGFKVGSVRNIDVCINEPDDRRFKVTFALEQPLDLPVDTRVDIFSTDLLGGMGIDLVWGSSSEMAENGAVLPSSVRLGLTDELLPLKDKTEVLVESLDTAIGNVNGIIGGENGKHLSDAIVALNATLENLEKITRDISKMTHSNGVLTESLTGLDSLMSSLGKQGGNINMTLDGLGKFSQQLAASQMDSLVATLNSTMSSLGSIITSVDSAQGTIGRLINDSKLYDKLAESSENLNRLLVDVRLNPSRYVKISAINFGKNTYFSDAGNGLAMIGLIYSVSLATSSVPLDFPTEIEGNKVIEYHKDKKNYEYLVGQFREKGKAEEFMLKMRATYKNAVVKAYEDGKEVSL